MQQQKNTHNPTNALGRFWMRIPMIVRSILSGLGVSTIGVITWILLITSLPGPWSFIIMGLILVFYWMYFSGKWRPSNTQAFRRFCSRQFRFDKSVLIWGLSASFFLFLFVCSGMVFTFRLVEFQPEVFKTATYLNDLPTWTAWSVIITASSVAGICEEFGFRGYMQKPLEEKHGPIAGISITSLVFVAVHLHQAWAAGILVQMFMISFMIGYLAYSTDSLLPGIIAHVSFDIVMFSYWWSDVVGTFALKPISMTSVDSHFVWTTVVVLLSVVLFVASIRKLLSLRMSSSVELAMG